MLYPRHTYNIRYNLFGHKTVKCIYVLSDSDNNNMQ